MREVLSHTEAEKDQVAAARAVLGQRLQEVEKALAKVTDEKRLAEHYKDIAPLYHVTQDDAPTLLLHGTADKLVPIQQSELIAAKFEDVGVPHRLYIKEDADHGWPSTEAEAQMIAEWFNKHLSK